MDNIKKTFLLGIVPVLMFFFHYQTTGRHFHRWKGFYIEHFHPIKASKNPAHNHTSQEFIFYTVIGGFFSESQTPIIPIFEAYHKEFFFLVLIDNFQPQGRISKFLRGPPFSISSIV